MTEFKVGDRVSYISSLESSRPYKGIVGRIQVYEEDGVEEYFVKWDEGSGNEPPGWYASYELTSIPVRVSNENYLID